MENKKKIEMRAWCVDDGDNAYNALHLGFGQHVNSCPRRCSILSA